jgi:hypothetical protein
MTEHTGIDRREREPATNDLPRGVDAAQPNVARIYDYLLGGKDNFASDRKAAEYLTQVMPEAVIVARENRKFLQRAVKFLASEAGIRQYLDIGTGLPTLGNVHHTAQQWRPDSRILYVDNDAVVVAHAQALLADNTTAIAINRDLRSPRTILDHPALQALFDLNEPIAILLVAVLHFIGDEDEPYRLVGEVMERMPRGSYLVISHGTADQVEPSVTRRVRMLYDRASSTATARSLSEIGRFFAGCDLIDPGIVSVSAWRRFETAESDRILCYAGLGIKR